MSTTDIPISITSGKEKDEKVKKEVIFEVKEIKVCYSYNIQYIDESKIQNSSFWDEKQSNKMFYLPKIRP